MILDGHGLENFEQIGDYSDPATTRVTTYRLKW
jgi:hypothetical protein